MPLIFQEGFVGDGKQDTFKGSFLSWHIKGAVMKLLDYKTRTGMILVWLYLAVCIWILFNLIDSSLMGLAFPLLILTVPCSVALVIIFNSFGMLTIDNDDYIVFICGLIGGAINALALYFLGYLLTRMFVFLKKAMWDK